VTCTSVVSGRARTPEERRCCAPVTHPCSPAGHGEGDYWELLASGRRPAPLRVTERATAGSSRRVGDGGDEETRRVVGF
jgi:hypothetical protein